MKLSDIKQVLTERDLRLTKSLGQNFLHDQNQIRRIVAAAELKPSDKVLEIGPGLGPLTEMLVAQGNEVLAIEKDQRLYDYLREKFNAAPNLKLLHEDALRHVEAHEDWTGWKLVANLPYSVASPILVELAQSANPPERMVATLQLEVAQRIEAASGTKQYGVLGLLLLLRYEACGSFKIPASCFFPPPDVDSACITLTRRAKAVLTPELEPVYKKIVKVGFSQRRKMLMKLLKQYWPADRLSAAFEKLALSPLIRAEDLTLEQFARLAELLEAK